VFCTAKDFVYQLLIDFVISEGVENRRAKSVHIETVPADAMQESFHALIAHAPDEFLLYTQLRAWFAQQKGSDSYKGRMLVVL